VSPSVPPARSGLLFLLMLMACGERGADPVQVARGEKLYAQHCASCHSARLEGQAEWRTRLPNGRMPAPPHDESGHTWHHSDEVLFGITKRGLVPPYAPPGYESDMPAFGGVLSDDEIRAVLAFMKSHWTSHEVLDTRAELLRNNPEKR
jgi:mono/diheme cytochrome c family protein